MTHHAAVLTGDLIGSTKAGTAAVDSTMTTLAAAAARLSAWAGADTRFTRYRGDGWQVYLARPGLVLRACLLLAASLRAADTGISTRISAGLGRIDRLQPTGLSDASGEAFILSGRGLDTMPKTAWLSLDGTGAAIPWQRAIFDLVEWQSARWSREQAEAVALALDPAAPSQSDLAASLGITRQALQARLTTAGFPALQQALRAFETTDTQQDAT